MDATKPAPSFDFAISYAGRDRSIAKRIAYRLSEFGATVFIDTMYRAHLVGRRLDYEFEWVFGSGTKYFVPIVSQSYVDRPWPQHEWSVAIREAEGRTEEFILPLRLDDSLLVGLPSQVGYIDMRQFSVDDTAALLLDKLRATHRVEITHWAATFGLLVEHVLSSPQLPPTVPFDYPHLCDWLAENLIARLTRSSIGNPKLTDDSRNGETFSVRVAFNWDPKDGPLQLSAPEWWDVLEILPYDQVYPETER